jgi:hypothetical protein
MALGNKMSLLKQSCFLLISGIGIGWLIGLSVSPVIYVVITSVIALVVSIISALAGLKLNEPETQSSDESRKKRRLQVEINPVPMTLTIVGLVIGASVGIYGRTNNWLGPRPSNFVERWKDTELSKKEISKRLFDELYPPKVEGVTPEQTSSQPNSGPSTLPHPTQDGAANRSGNSQSEATHQTTEKTTKDREEKMLTGNEVTQRSLSPVLFSATVDECASFRTATDEDLKNQLTHLSGSSSQAEQTRQEAKSCPSAACLRRIVQRICQNPRAE